MCNKVPITIYHHPGFGHFASFRLSFFFAVILIRWRASFRQTLFIVPWATISTVYRPYVNERWNFFDSHGKNPRATAHSLSRMRWRRSAQARAPAPTYEAELLVVTSSLFAATSFNYPGQPEVDVIYALWRLRSWRCRLYNDKISTRWRWTAFYRHEILRWPR